MEFRHLEIIRQAVACGFNLTRVAAALYVSQPGVSRQIRELEEELGVQVFVRVGKKILGLTLPGEEVLASANVIMEESSRLKSLVVRFEANPRGVLRIAATSPALPLLSNALAGLRASYPEVRSVVRQCGADEVAEALVHNRADIGIGGRGMLGKAGVIARACPKLRFVIAGLREFFATAPAPPDLERLAALPLLCYPENYVEQQQVEAAFRRAGLQPAPVLTGDADFLLSCAQAGLGVAIVCASCQGIAEKAKELTAYDAGSLFEDVSMWLALRRGKLPRDFEACVCRALIPGLDMEAFQKDILAREVGKWEREFAV
ncbi:MAG: LysR family transcriptional regulator [Deltaproteobacteria bacterium]|jgi:LysR family cys regulon transcriptional activator|nr:LysR family transcriptional regulator [Deltaproteobacteria bacterium]